jgi:hypothetical protein
MRNSFSYFFLQLFFPVLAAFGVLQLTVTLRRVASLWTIGLLVGLFGTTVGYLMFVSDWFKDLMVLVGVVVVFSSALYALGMRLGSFVYGSWF